MEIAILPSSEYQAACGKRLRKLLQVLRMSNTSAADIMGVSKQVLNHWLQGKHPVQAYPLYRLCRARGIDFNYVFLGDWSNLPQKVVNVFDGELKASLGHAPARDRMDHES